MANKRRFEMIEGSSSKFWEVTYDAASYTVTYGRIGTTGTTQTTQSPHPATAVDKLIAEKLRKGYQELGAAERNWRPPKHINSHEHIDRFLNYEVVEFNPDADADEDADNDGRRIVKSLRELNRLVCRIGLTYDDASEEFAQRLDALLADKKVAELRALVIGNWYSEVCEEAPNELFTRLIKHGHVLRSLQGLFVGDIIQEESEISWLHQGDYAPILHALPDLQELVVRGGEGLRLQNLRHHGLRALTLQSGGLSAETVRDVAQAQLPELRQLTLWLGIDSYGGDSSIEDLAPILAGDRFSQLEHLGLQDSENADAIAQALATAPILKQLKGLDLSMGTLSDDGARALLAAPAIRSLKYLNLRHHYMSVEMVKEMRTLGIEVNTADRQESAEDDDRYAEVTE